MSVTHPEGAVGEYECRETAHYERISWGDWTALSVRDKVYYVAHKRAVRLLELHYAADASNALG